MSLVSQRSGMTPSALYLRRRSVWEAVDSGILLWRCCFFYFIPFFALPAWIIACGLRLLPGKWVYFSYLALWWLKPLFDRLVLHVVSRGFFGSPDATATPGDPRNAVRGKSRFRGLLKGLGGDLFRGLAGDLLWRRFSPARSARMPIRVLERVSRNHYRLRRKSLAAGGLDFGTLITILGFIMEGMLLFGEIMFVIMITQIFSPAAFEYMGDNLESMEIFIFAAFCLNFIFVESLYVCMGFGLYINSRVEVEGWDLQLLFRKFAERGPALKETPALKATSKTGSSSFGTGARPLLLGCLFLALLSGPAVHGAYADAGEQDSPPPLGPPPPVEAPAPLPPIQYFPDGFPSANEKALGDLEKILASPDFGGEKEGWGIRLKNAPKRTETPHIDLAPWVEKIRQIFGFMLRFIAVCVIAGFAIFALFWFLKNRRKGRALFRKNGKSYVNSLVPVESPEKLFARAEEFFHLGRLREAWAACLSGCIGAYSRYRSLSFPADATEYGCLDLVRRSLPGEAGSFGDLVQSWILFAYGGRIPAEGDFERALAYGRSLGFEPLPAEPPPEEPYEP